MPPASKRTDEYFSMVTGISSSAWGPSSTVEEMVPVTMENILNHFKGVPGYYPDYMRLGNDERIYKKDVQERFNIKLPE